MIVDDYGNAPACRQAVHDFRSEHGVAEPIERIDWGGVFWRRSASAVPRIDPVEANRSCDHGSLG